MSSKVANIFFSREAIASCGSECLSALLLHIFKIYFFKNCAASCVLQQWRLLDE